MYTFHVLSLHILEGKQYKNELDVHDFLRKINIPRLKTQGTMHRIAVNSHKWIFRHQIYHCVVDYSLIRSCLKAQEAGCLFSVKNRVHPIHSNIFFPLAKCYLNDKSSVKNIKN